MDKQLLSSLTALETALTSLTESISSQAPSLPAAHNLLSANTTLTQNLSHLKTHTENILLLAHLHSLAAQLAETYKHQVATLSEIRSEILRVNISGPQGSPSPTPDTAEAEITGGSKKLEDKNAVEYHTLLAFARSVSHNTAPRGFKPPSVLRAEEEAKEASTGTVGGTRVENEDGKMNMAGQQQPLVNSGTVATNGLEPVMNGVQNEQAQSQAQSRTQGNPAMQSLAPDVKAWLDPQLQTPFLPWPNEDMVARSGLARVSGWVGAVSAEENVATAAVEQAEADTEAQKKKDEEQMAAAARYDDYERQQVRSAPKPKVFTGLDLYDPDEE